MTDFLGPQNAANVVTYRPSDTRGIPGSFDSFFRDCSSPSALDGTAIQAGWLNQVTATLRALARMGGLKLDGVTKVLAEDNANDSILAQAVMHVIQRGQVVFAQDTGLTANYVVAAPNPAPVELIHGMRIGVYKNSQTNSGPVTASIGGFAGAPVTWPNGDALEANDWPASTTAILQYTGAGWTLETVPGRSVFARKIKSVTANLGSGMSLSNGVLSTVTGLTGSGNADVSLTTSYLTINKAGLYLLDLTSEVDVSYSGASNYWASMYLLRNGTSILPATMGASYYGYATSGLSCNGARSVYLAAADVLQLNVVAYASSFVAATLSLAILDVTRLD